jgi:hypothetical protein
MTSEVLVPADRLPRWVQNFTARHGDAVLAVESGRLCGSAEDGSSFAAGLPFGRSYAGPPAVADIALEAAPPQDWGVLLVRKGGFAVARLAGRALVDSKVGQRHVQGRTKAGGQSQQRFARRRDNQARAAYEAAAEHAVRLVGDAAALVVGGDAGAVAAVLADPRLRQVAGRVVGDFLTVPDPRRAVLEEAVLDAGALRIAVANA